MEAEKVLQEIAGQVAECKRCQLSYSRKKSVPGEGPANAEIMLIGEGPGFYENEQGRPFVGAAGKFLDELLEKAGVSRKTVFITNVVKCRPPGNRDPQPDELQSCGDYLDRQIAAINPLIIVTLGRFSMSKFLYNARISEVHGKPVWARGRMIVPMFHPAAALHQPSLKTSVEQDFARLPEFIQQARQQAGNQPDSVKNGAAAGHAIAEPKTPLQAETKEEDRPAAMPQQSLFGDLLDAPPEEKKEEPEKPSGKDQPTQLSLF